MANKKISQLPSKTTLSQQDLLPIVDVEANPYVTKKTTVASLRDGLVTQAIVGVANGLATLDSNGRVPSLQLPAIAVTTTTVVNSQAAMLALSVTQGAVAIRTDLRKSFILASEPASTLSNWQELLTPTDAVTSVNGQTGVVTINVFSGSYNDLTNKPLLFSGSYNDLSNTPDLFDGNYDSLTNKPDLSQYVTGSSLATVATSGSYTDLDNKPFIPSSANDVGAIPSVPGTQGDVLTYNNGMWTASTPAVGGVSSVNGQTGAVTLNVFSGSYADLTNKPVLFSGAYADLTGKPILFSGSYTDLTNKPVLFSGAYADLTGKPDLSVYLTSAPVTSVNGQTGAVTLNVFSGSYADLTNKPQLFSGAYADLTGKPDLSVYLTTAPVTSVNGQTGAVALSAADVGAVIVAPDWTANHTLAAGTRYLTNDVVYAGGNIYRALHDNESEPVTNTTYWQNIGAGSRINIDGRDIPNIPYPVTSVNGQTGNVTVTGGSSLPTGNNGDVLTYSNGAWNASPLPTFGLLIDGGSASSVVPDLIDCGNA